MNILKKITILLLISSIFFVGCRSLEKETDSLIPHRTKVPLLRPNEYSIGMENGNSILFKELPNGLKVIVIEMPFSTIAYGMISFKVGGRYEPESHAGISHFLEHMLFKEKEGSEPVSEIRRMGGNVNALTDYELTTYYFTVLPEHFEESMTALSNIVLEPKFDSKDLANEREVVLEELARGKNDPRTLVLSSLVKEVFPSSPLTNLVIGNEQSIRRITLADLYAFHKAYYIPGNMIVVCAGAIDAKPAIRLVESLFGNLMPLPIPDISFEDPEIAVSNLTKEIPVNQAFHITGILVPGKAEEDYYEMMLLDVLLGSGINSRLHKRIVIDEGLTEEIYPYHYSLSDTGIWAIMLSVEPEDTERARKIIDEEIKGIKDGLFSDYDLSIAKQALKSRLLITLDRPMELAHFELESLAFRRDILTLQEHTEKLEAISRHDIILAARRHLTADNTITISLKPAPVPNRWFLILKLLLTGEL
ncbi:MAG: insulinase family protein [Spirochaetota bacterium]|nr:MAG: insulinase family protein [Spirochaetota bacterium]